MSSGLGGSGLAAVFSCCRMSIMNTAWDRDDTSFIFVAATARRTAARQPMGGRPPDHGTRWSEESVQPLSEETLVQSPGTLAGGVEKCSTNSAFGCFVRNFSRGKCWGRKKGFPRSQAQVGSPGRGGVQTSFYPSSHPSPQSGRSITGSEQLWGLKFKIQIDRHDERGFMLRIC